VLLVLCLGLRIDKNIIDEDNDELIKERLKNLVHQIHEYGRCISQAEWHDQELK